MNFATIGDVLRYFLSLILEGGPYILLGAVISGIMEAYLPKRAMERLLPGNKYGAVLVAGLLGAIFPVCECAIVPVIRRLVAKGLPVACAITYMLSAPIINPIVALSTWSAFPTGSGGNLHPALPWLMTGSRFAMGYMIAVAVGIVVTRIAAKSIVRPGILPAEGSAAALKNEKNTQRPTGDDGGQRLIHALRTAQRDFVDVALYFAIGALIASLFKAQLIFRPEVQQTMFSLANNLWIAPLVLMVLAFLLSLCSTTDAFIIATVPKFSLSSKLAFLVFGPMMDVKLLFLYSAIFQKRFVIALIIVLTTLTWLLSQAFHTAIDIPVQR